MTIKSDKWIRRMAQQHGLIEPFEPGQVREVEGRRVISYGTSSYGWLHLRRAPEFKVFNNIHDGGGPWRASTRKASSTSTKTSASFRPTASRWRARWSTSAFRATC